MESSSDGWGDWDQTGDQTTAEEAADRPKSPQEGEKSPRQTTTNGTPHSKGDTPKGVSSKLESLGREDLVKFVKKQMVLLQRSKVKCDELTKEVATQKKILEEKHVSSDTNDQKVKQLEGTLEEVMEERDSAMAGYRAGQEAQEATLDQIKALEEEVSLVTSNNTALEEKVRMLDQQNKSLNERVECMLMKDETMTTSFLALQEELDKMATTNKEQQQEIEVQKEARDQALNALRDLKSQKASASDDLEVQLEEQKSLYQKLKDDTKELEAETSNLKTEHEKLSSEAQASEKKVQELRDLLTEAQQQAEKSGTELAESRQSNVQLQADLDQLSQELSKETKAAEEKHGNLTQQLQEAKSALESAREETSAMQTQLEDLNKYETQTSEIEIKLKAAHERIKVLEEQEAGVSKASELKVMDLEAQLESSKAEVVTLQGETVEWHQQQGIMKAEIQEYVKAVELLNKQLEDIEAQKSKVKQLDEETASTLEALGQIKQERDIAQRKVLAANEKFAEWESLIQMLKEDRDKLEMEVVVLEERESVTTTELDDLNSSLMEALQERDTLRDQVCKMSEEGSVSRSLSTLKQTLAELNFERDELNEKVASLQEQLDQLNKDNELLNSENELQAKDVRQLKDKAKQWDDEKRDLETELKSFRIQNDELLNQLQKENGETQTSAAELVVSRMQLQEVEKEKEQLMIEVEEHKRQVGICEQEMTKSRKKMEETTRQLESFLPEREILEKKLADLSALRRQSDGIRDENDQLRLQTEELQLVKEELAEKQKELYSISELRDQLQDQLASFKDKHHSLEDNYHQLKVQEETRESDKRTLEEQKTALEKEAADLKSCLGESTSREAALEDRVAQLQEEINQASLQLTQLQQHKAEDLSSGLDKGQTLQSLSEEKKVLLEEMDDQKSKISGTEERCEKLEIEVNRAQQDVSDKDAEIKIMSDNIERLTTEKETLTGQLVEVKELTTGLQGSLVEVCNSKDECEKIIEQLKSENNDVIEENRHLKKSHSELDISLAEAKGKLEHSEGEQHKLSETLATQEEEMEGLRSVLESLQAGSDTTAQEAQQVLAELAEVRGERASLEEKIRVLQANQISAKEETTRIQEEFTSNQEELESLRKELEESRSAHGQMDAVRQTLQEQFAVLQSKLVENASDLAASQEQLAETQHQKQLGQDSVSDTQSQLDEIKKEFHDSQQVCEELRRNLTDSEQNKTALTEKINEYDKQQSILKEQLQTIQEEKDALEAKLTEAEEKDQHLSGRLTESEACESSAKRKCADVQQQLKVMADQLRGLEGVRQQLMGKEAELAELRQANTSAEALQQAQAHGERVAAMEKEVKETKDKANKFKQLALKAKKELNEYKTKLEKMSTDLDSLKREKGEVAQNCQKLQSALDSSEAAMDEVKESTALLTSELEATREELSRLQDQLAVTQEEVVTMKAQLVEVEAAREAGEQQKSEFLQEREAARIQREQLGKDKHQVEAEVSRLKADLQKTDTDHEVTIKAIQAEVTTLQNRLSTAQKEAQQSSMMDLEIADYERTMQTLNEQIAERDLVITECRAETARQEENVAALQKQLESAEGQSRAGEDRANKLKQLLIKAKKDLADAKKIEGEQRSTDAQLRGKLEMLTQQAEEHKIQISGLVAENQKLGEKMRGSTDSHQRSVRLLENKVTSLQQDLEVTRSELEMVQAEYDGYKVRVHNVLKQQKTKAPNDASAECEKQERKRLEEALEQLKNKVQEVSDQLTGAQTENEILQEEHERLQLRHARLLQDLDDKETSWQTKFEHISAENNASRAEYSDIVQQMTRQNETVSFTFKEQLKVMQEEHQKVVDLLQRQLVSANAALVQRPHTPIKSPTHDTDDTDGQRDPRHEERQAAEGMELPEPESYKKVSLSNTQSMIPLEQLLNSPPQTPGAAPMSLEMLDDGMLQLSLETAQKRIEHLTELMNESEATVLRLTEQARVLKEEIRRQERNAERNQHVEKAEYLKNIILKFLTLKTEDERKQLIPVLTTMLRLSPEEKNTLMSIARGGSESAPEESESAGWSAYLHRWSGLV